MENPVDLPNRCVPVSDRLHEALSALIQVRGVRSRANVLPGEGEGAIQN